MSVDARGILLAGIVVGSLGVLDDVTVTQVSAVGQLRRSQPDASAAELYRSALTIGRDHISPAINTLVRRTQGASLPISTWLAARVFTTPPTPAPPLPRRQRSRERPMTDEEGFWSR